jgi:hypothetical protein
MTNKILATAVRVETDLRSDRLFLVFEVIDPEFKRQVKKDWTQDLELKIINRELVKHE